MSVQQLLMPADTSEREVVAEPGFDPIDVTPRVTQDKRPSTNLRARLDVAVADLKEATQVIVQNHYLHRGRTMAQMPYWVHLDSRRVGVILYAYPRMSAKYHGYAPMNLVELARMWLHPAVQGLRIVDSHDREHAFTVATCAVGKSLRRIRADWHGKYPHLPDVLAVVSWADQEHHEGTIYRAANFREVGTSGGSLHGNTLRPNGGHDQLNPDYLHLKTAFLYEYARPLSRTPNSVAELAWRQVRSSGNRVRTDQLPEMQGRLSLEEDSVASDVGP